MSAMTNLQEEIAAARTLIAAGRGLFDDDEEIAATALEGETGLHEQIALAAKRLCEIESVLLGARHVIERMTKRMHAYDDRRAKLRAAIATAMDVARQKRIETPVASLSLRPVAPSVHISNEGALPEQFMREKIVREPDKLGIRNAIQSGLSVPGAVLSGGGITVNVKWN